jgi:hypothetical protein
MLSPLTSCSCGEYYKYLKGTSSYGLYQGGSAVNCPLYGFRDADFAACPVTRRSVTGYVIKCCLGAIA